MHKESEIENNPWNEMKAPKISTEKANNEPKRSTRITLNLINHSWNLPFAESLSTGFVCFISLSRASNQNPVQCWIPFAATFFSLLNDKQKTKMKLSARRESSLNLFLSSFSILQFCLDTRSHTVRRENNNKMYIW